MNSHLNITSFAELANPSDQQSYVKLSDLVIAILDDPNP